MELAIEMLIKIGKARPPRRNEDINRALWGADSLGQSEQASLRVRHCAEPELGARGLREKSWKKARGRDRNSKA